VERSGERALQKNDGAERGAGGHGAGTERGAEQWRFWGLHFGGQWSGHNCSWGHGPILPQ